MSSIRETIDIPLEKLTIAKGQVRLREVGKDIDELANSIAKIGLLEPIIVAPTADGKFEIITGQRRFLAHQRLAASTIKASVLDGPIDETTAKVISLTENMVRRDLNTRDLIDACTELYKKYGTVRAVSEETGLPYNKVNEYVKYDRLIPELRSLYDSGEIKKIDIALKAQDAATSADGINAPEAVVFAREMNVLSGAQRNRILQERKDKPAAPADEVIERAKAGTRTHSITLQLTPPTFTNLQTYAKAAGTEDADAATDFIEEGLSRAGYAEAE
jgi:ParB family chromosome partitioning protein